MPAGGFYNADLAAIHAAGFSRTYADGFDWLADQIDGPLYDLGCGDGTWMIHAKQRGIPVAGCDVSDDFVDMARARGLDITHASAHTAPLPDRTTHVTALGEVLSYGTPDAPHPVKTALAHLATHGGLRWIGFDVIGPDVPARSHSGEGDGWRYVSKVTLSDGCLCRAMTVTRGDRTSEITHYQHISTPDAVASWLDHAGFDCDIGQSYGPASLLPGRFRVIARRR